MRASYLGVMAVLLSLGGPAALSACRSVARCWPSSARARPARKPPMRPPSASESPSSTASVHQYSAPCTWKVWRGGTKKKLRADTHISEVPMALPMDNLLFRQIVKLSPLGYKLNDDNSVTTQFNLLNVGSAQMLTIPGEALPNIGYYLKRHMYGTSNFLFGLTNDAFGYILTKVDFNSFERYNYVSRTSLGEMTGEILIEHCLGLVADAPLPQNP